MMPLAMIGLLLMAGLVGYGAYRILGSITFKKTTDRYKTVKAKDENGNDIDRIVDLEKDHDE